MAYIERFFGIIGLLPEGSKFINRVEVDHSLLGFGEVFACGDQLLELALFVF